MADDLYQLHCSDLPSSFVAAFVGRERLSQIYELDIGFTVTGAPAIDLETPVGQRAKLEVVHGKDTPAFDFHGILASVELVHAFPGHTLYVAKLVPELYKLRLTHHNRIFTDVTIPQIIEAVLEEEGFSKDSDYRLELVGSYPDLEHVCQYRESYFDFLSRLMEREGMYYYFEQGQEREVLVITDAKIKHDALSPKPVHYFPSPEGDTSSGQSLRTFRARSQVLPKAVQLRDYDYNNPKLDLSSGHAVIDKSSGEIVLYGEHYNSPTEGERYARVRAEELLATRNVVTGGGVQFHLRSGYLFTLEDHPALALNREYLAVEVEHVGKDGGDQYLQLLFDRQQNDDYVATVKAIPSDVQFRAPRATPWPRIDGLVDGVVFGADDGPYAEIDEHGRYKVRVFFDEGDMVDGSNSTWIRMLQPHGGSPEGFHMPLHKGTEVHVAFLSGHPDRPAIVGAAHNTTKPSAVNASNHTQHILRTHANNLLMFEDISGGLWGHMSTPGCNSYLHLGMPGQGSVHNFDLNTACKGRIHTGDSLEMFVDTWKKEIVGADITEEYVGPFKTTVNNAVDQIYENVFNLTVTDKTTIKYDNQLELDVTLAADEHYHDTRDVTVTGALTEIFEDSQTTTVTSGGQTLNVTDGQTVDISGGQQITVQDGDLVEDITTNYTLGVDSLFDVTAKNCNYNVGQVMTITVGTDFKINSPQWYDTYIHKIAAGIIKADAIGTEFKVAGLRAAAHGIKAEANGVELKANLFESKNTPMKLSLFGTWIGCKLIDFKLGFLIRG